MKKQYFAMIMFIAIAVASMTACGVHTEAAAEETKEVTSESIPEQTTVVETVPVSIQETPVPTQAEAEESSAEKGDSSTAEEALAASTSPNTLEGGANIENAVSLPIAFKAYGTVRDRAEAWYTFTTGDGATEYRVTTVNKTPSSGPVITYLFDETGAQLERKGAEIDGASSTIVSNTLMPNTKYYLKLQRFEDRIGENDYVLFISSSNQHVVSVLKSADGESDAVNNGSNQDDAVLLPLGTKRYGTARNRSNIWYAFTTGEDYQTYRITTINKSLTNGAVITFLYDEYGTPLERKGAENDGVASTIDISSLAANTTYYLRIQRFVDRDGSNDFVITIHGSEHQQDGNKTADNLIDARGTSEAMESTIHPGTNQDEPAYILYGYKVSSKVSGSVGEWYAFTTEQDENAAYTITTENKSSEGGPVITYLYDEYGNQLGREGAENNGDPSVLTPESLDPNTTYYIRVVRFQSDDVTNDYSLFVDVSVPSEEHVATVEKTEEEPLVFEVPFELNETQVHFVANEAIFIDEEAAIAALAPVAEIILAHPDHPILLAGTTATWGSQDSCVNLSNRRAGAVRDLLVNYYGVPEDQLKTIGLGFAADPFVRGQDVDSNGNFIETEGAKNRRTIIMDAEDPIAKELLGE